MHQGLQRSAVGAGQVALACQGREVVAQGDLADREHLGQLGDADFTSFLDQLQDFLLAFLGKHACIFRFKVVDGT